MELVKKINSRHDTVNLSGSKCQSVVVSSVVYPHSFIEHGRSRSCQGNDCMTLPCLLNFIRQQLHENLSGFIVTPQWNTTVGSFIP